jgi:L-ascorbate metabolism protein UlaG (beta-lactamase superfamily)
MEIAWLGHSSLRFRSNDVTLITDPYADSIGYSMGRPKGDIVTVSNDHPHHSNVDAVEGSPRVVQGPGEYEIANFYISGIGTRGGGLEGERRINTVFTIRVEDLTLCHLGDLNQTLSPRQVQELNPTDVLFVPAGGSCTISAARVAELVNLIGPRLVVPVHYSTEGIKVQLEPLDGFLAEMGVSALAPQATLNVTSTNLPRELRVVVLQRVT